jgi:hypothetical protein
VVAPGTLAASSVGAAFFYSVIFLPPPVKVKNPKAPAVEREAEEDWDRSRELNTQEEVNGSALAANLSEVLSRSAKSSA